MPEGWLATIINESDSSRVRLKWEDIQKVNIGHMLGRPSEILRGDESLVYHQKAMDYGIDSDEKTTETWKYKTPYGCWFINFKDSVYASCGTYNKTVHKYSVPSITNLSTQITNPFKDFSLDDVELIVFATGSKPLCVVKEKEDIRKLYRLASSLVESDVGVGFCGFLVSVRFYRKNMSSFLAEYSIYMDCNAIRVIDSNGYDDKTFHAKSEQLILLTIEMMQKYCPERLSEVKKSGELLPIKLTPL